MSAPRPDFDLRVVPSSINARAGLNVPLTVYAMRKDGFTNEIMLTLNDPPPGFILSGARIPPNQDQVRITLAAPATSLHEPVRLSLEGYAFTDGQRLTRPVVPAEDMEQAFAYHHLVPSQELMVAVSGRGMGRTGLKILATLPLKLPAGGAARFTFATPGPAFTDRFQLELSRAPEGITIERVAPAAEGAEIVLHTDADKIKPGVRGNLIINVLPGKNPSGSAAPKRQANQRRPALDSLPAIPFEIVEKTEAGSP